MTSAPRPSHCPAGHEYPVDDAYIYPDTRTYCPQCAAAKQKPPQSSSTGWNKSRLFPQEVREQRFKEERGKCQWCHKPIVGRWHAHHILPVSQGGDHSPSNCMVLHPGCHNNPLIFAELHPGIEMPACFNSSSWRIYKK